MSSLSTDDGLFTWATSGIGSLIAGEWVMSNHAFEVREKFSDLPFAQVSTSTSEQINTAIGIARRAADGELPTANERALILHRAAAALATERGSIRALLVAEVGMTLSDADSEISRALVTLRLSGEEATRLAGETVAFGASPGADSRLGFTVRHPKGVVCAITPFNSPLNVVAHKIAPALAAGNAVIVKPSSLAPLSAAVLCKVLVEAGLPPELLSLVNGEGREGARQLLEDQRIDFYTFTGSTRVGRAVAAGAGIRGTQLELGSIASTILGASADLDVAIPKIVNAAFRKAGQVCTSTQFVHVDRLIESDAVARLVAATRNLRVGDPTDPSVRVGPLVSPAAVDRLRNWIDSAVAGGARVLTGGDSTATTLDPIILTDVPNDSPLMLEEAFGPILVVRPFDAFAKAIAVANSTPYGLSCGVFSNDYSEVREAIAGLRFGGIHINEASSARADEMPFGGVKESGHGFEGPRYAIREYTEERLVTLNQ